MNATNAGGKTPVVSIGLPVYNGGELLKTALDTLTAQEFTDFELIISDNASTDRTEELCRDYAARDARIRYLRRDRNYGMGDNGRNTFKFSRGKYFMPAAYDDQWDPRFIGACVERLEANPRAVLATTDIDFFNPDGTPAAVICPPLHTVGMGLRDRVAALFHEVNAGYHAYGVFRKDSLLGIDFNVDCYAGDLVLLLRLMFLGEVEHIPRTLFRYRFVRRTTQEHLDAVSAVPGECRPTKLYTMLTINLLRSILNAPVSPPLKRVLVSDVLGIIAVKNIEWQQHLLLENKSIVPFVTPEQDGALPMLEANLIGVFAALLLPYCRQGDGCERSIDFSAIEGFHEILPIDSAKPAPGYKEFLDRCIYLLERKEYARVVDYYDRYGRFQPDSEAIRKADAVIRKLRSHAVTASAAPPRQTSPEPTQRLRIAFQHQPPVDGRPNWDAMIQQRLRDRLVARGHDVVFVKQADASIRKRDIVHFFSLTPPQGGQSVLDAAIESGIPFIITALEDAASFCAAKAQRWFRILRHYIEQGQSPEAFENLRNAPDTAPSQSPLPLSVLAARDAARVLVCGPAEARLLEKTVPLAKIAVVPLGVDEEQPDTPGERFEDAFGISNFVLCVGPLEPHNNQLMLLKALEHEEIPVVLVDGGPTDKPDYAEFCRKLRRKGPTVFTGSIPDELLASAYRAARLFCLPSWYDLPGLVTLEAASFGCAVVASKEGCVEEYLGELCDYCRPDSPESIHNAVLTAYRAGPKPGLRKRASSFTWEEAAKRIETVYRESIKEKQKVR